MNWLIISAISTVISLISIFAHHRYVPYGFEISVVSLVIAIISFALWTRYSLDRIEIDWESAPEEATHFNPVTRQFENSELGKVSTGSIRRPRP